MAIKAIINNTEKEIEQIKNSDEKDIDYVYSRIGDTEVEGAPPISIKSIGGNLADYRIYGQTVDGESVGDRTANLFDEDTMVNGITDAYINSDGTIIYSQSWIVTPYIPCNSNVITLTFDISIGNYPSICLYDENKNYITGTAYRGSRTITVTTEYVAKYIRFSYTSYTDLSKIMLNAGSTALPYESFGYKVPVTVEGKNLFDENYFIQTNLYGQNDTLLTPDPYTISTIIPCNPNTKYTISKIVTNRFAIWGCTDYPTQNNYCNSRIASDHDGSSLTFTTGNDDNYLLIMLFYKRQPTDPTIEDVKGSLMFNYGEALPYEPYHAPVTTPIYLPEQMRKVGDEAEYISYANQKLHRVGADDIDVTLPALSTIKGTNTFSVNTSIQPSNIYIKDSFDYKKVFTATRTIEGESPLNYRSIEDSDSTLKNYRIYGNTAGGESVGDKTGNLFDKSGSQYGNNLHWGPTFRLIYSDTYYGSPIMDVTGLNTITRSYTGTGANYFSTSDLSQFVNVSNIGTVDAGVTVNVPDGYTKYVFNIPNTISPDSIMVNAGSTALPYEPYGYKVPVTVSNDTDTLTTPIYLHEPIKMVGNEAEYIDYGEQKQHRVRKNLLPNEVTSRTINGVAFTVNNDGSVTCNGTASNIVFYVISSEAFSLPAGRYKLNGAPTGGGQNYNFKLDVRVSTNKYYPDTGNGGQFSILQGEPITLCRIVIYSGYTCDNLTFYPMIRKTDIEDDTYEPYIENTELDITLPALPTLAGTNTLTVGTEVQPSSVEIKGHIK